MTTTVTVKTHDWPVAVSTNSNHSFTDRNVRSHGYTDRTEFVPAHTERSFTVSNTTSVSVRELPEEATSLDDAYPTEGADACSASNKTAPVSTPEPTQIDEAPVEAEATSGATED